jgi:DNA-binding IclR family transcriptional regulator
VRLVSRTIEVLSALADAPDGLGVTRLAHQLGESPSSVHRLLTALAAHDYVSQDPQKRYRLGIGVLGLAHAFQRQDTLVALAKPHLTRLVASTRESVFLSELIGDDVVCVASAESPRMLSFYMRIGQRTPYHAAASARAIIAFKPAPEQLRLMRAERIERFTDRTPTSVAEGLAVVREARAKGYAVCDEEMEVGVRAVSVPIADADGEVVASLTVVAPQDRLSGSAEVHAARTLAQASRAISFALGRRRQEGETETPMALEPDDGFTAPFDKLATVDLG